MYNTILNCLILNLMNYGNNFLKRENLKNQVFKGQKEYKSQSQKYLERPIGGTSNGAVKY